MRSKGVRQVYRCLLCNRSFIADSSSFQQNCQACDALLIESKGDVSRIEVRERKRSAEGVDDDDVDLKRALRESAQNSISKATSSSTAIVVVLEDEEEDICDICLICDVDLLSLSLDQREAHTENCVSKFETNCIEIALTQHGIDFDRDAIENSQLSDRGLRATEFFCVICDADLSKKRLVGRSSHLKKCAKRHGIATKELLQLIAPVSDGDPFEGPLEEGPAEEESTEESAGKQAEEEPAKKNAWSFLMCNAKAVFAAKAAATPVDAGSKKRGGWGFGKPKTAPGYAPDFKAIKIGSMQRPILVDAFQYACSALTDTYFLTHFHSDHYIGLDRHFDCGTVYCSPTTAALVQLRLKLPRARIVSLTLDTTHTITVGGSSVSVVLLDANHCPGAVCISFSFDNGRRVLHTGDFRWCGNLLESSRLYRSIAHDSSNSRQLTVYLDTTYCDPTYAFPPQDEAVRAVLACVKDEAAKPGLPLFVFGAYGIGKERVFMAAAEALDAKVFVEKARWQGMMCFDWAQDTLARLTTNIADTNIIVAPMNRINFSSMTKLHKRKPRCTRVVAFQPTGWTHTATAKSSSGLLAARTRGQDTIYSVPYSEHSSFTELVDFVKTFRPNKIVPTVNTGNKALTGLLYEQSGLRSAKTVASDFA